jgi:AcrR family transcriptional regulator
MGRSIWSVTAATQKSASTRERLLEVAAPLFYERGFHAIGIDNIIEGVGVTKTTFYNHFESKDALIVAVLEHRDKHDFDALRAEIDARGGTPRERLMVVFDVLEEWLADPDFRGCLFINAATQFPHEHDPVHQAAARHGEHLRAELAGLTRAAGAPDPDALAAQLSLLVAAAVTSRHTLGDTSAAATARQVAETLLDRLPAAAGARR